MLHITTQLLSKAEALRLEIKALVAQATPKSDAPTEEQTAVFTENVRGDKSYSGKWFSQKASRLLYEMGLGKEWGWSLVYLSQTTPIVNQSSRMYIVPLSEGASINPGGELVEGSAHFVNGEPLLSLHSTVMFIIPMEKR